MTAEGYREELVVKYWSHLVPAGRIRSSKELIRPILLQSRASSRLGKMVRGCGNREFQGEQGTGIRDTGACIQAAIGPMGFAVVDPSIEAELATGQLTIAHPVRV